MTFVSRDFDHFVVRATAFAAFSIPALLGVITASHEPYWLDAPEFTAAVQTLGIPHPPGHPLYIILTKPFTLIPLGGIAFRVSLASVFYCALASLLLFYTILSVLRRLAPTLETWIGATVSLASVLMTIAAQGWWLQAVRQEVYSLQILILLCALLPFVTFCLSPPQKADVRHLYLATFMAGIGLTNHHFIMVSALPCAIPQLVALSKRMSARKLMSLLGKLAATGLFGVLPYLYLPLRSAAGVAISLGGVHSWQEFFWVVSAKIYQKSMVRQHASSFDERSVDAFFTLMGQLGPVIVLVSLSGFYMMLRRKRTRMVGVLMTLVAAVPLLLRATMGFDRFNPDYYGYLMPTMASLSVGFAVFSAVFIHVIKVNLKFGHRLAIAGIALLMLTCIVRARSAYGQVDLSRFNATRLIKDMAFGQALPGTLAFAFDYNLFFALWSARYIDGSRPDISVVNPTMLTYPGYLNSTLASDEHFKPLARAMLVHGQLTEAAVADLALKRPLRMEPALDLSDLVVRYMRPDGLLYETGPEPLASSDVIAASPSYLEKWRLFYHLVGEHWRERETLRILTWTHYQDALFMARRGDKEGALKVIEMADATSVRAPEFDALKNALLDWNGKPLDIAPFMPKISSAGQ